MPNWCYTDITFYSIDKKTIVEMQKSFYQIFANDNYTLIREYIQEFLPETNPEDKKWVRGGVISVNEPFVKSQGLWNFSIATETAYAPRIEIWDKIIRTRFPNVNIAYIAEEPGCSVYQKWDETDLFYPELIRIAGRVPTKSGEMIYLDEDERSWSLNFEEAKGWLQDILPFDFTLTESGDDIDDKLQEYVLSNSMDDGEDFWITVGVFEEIPPDEFAF